MYREGVVTDQMCKKWFAKFRAGDVSLDYAPWSGRTVEVDSNQIEILIENNSTFCLVQDSGHTKNIQINNIIGVNEKCVFYRKNETKFLANPTQPLEETHLLAKPWILGHHFSVPSCELN